MCFNGPVSGISYSRSGFTIVELLIVIVVIAILATISIVAYTGIQTRAQNTVTNQAVAQYAKAFESYKAINGSYPVGQACISGAGTRCGNVIDSTYSCFGVKDVYGSASVDAAIKTVIATLPQPSPQQMSCSTGLDYAGAYYDGGSRLIWFLNGSQTCDNLGGMNTANTLVSGNVTRCFAYLP